MLALLLQAVPEDKSYPAVLGVGLRDFTGTLLLVTNSFQICYVWEERHCWASQVGVAPVL